MEKQKKKKRLAYAIMRLSVLPISILGIILTVYGQNSVREGMVFEVQTSLSGIAHNLLSMYNMLDAGEFTKEGDKVMKGEMEFTADYRMLDDLKNDTGADVTIFIGDERCLTTLVNEEGKRMTGTTMSEEVKTVVLEGGEEYFSQSVEVVDADYFGYYVPIRDDEGNVIGASFAGKSVESINTSMSFMIQGNIVICLFVILSAIFFCNLSSQKMVRTIKGIKRFLGRVAKGEFSHRMPKYIQERRDELGEMGQYAVTVSRSLEEVITSDPLTKLLNRRAGETLLKNREDQQVFTIVMADVDFFKSVNDTYGHDKGDEVLCFVAGKLKEITSEIGFAARWGGEEFLLGFDCEAKEVVTMLDTLREDILSNKFAHEENEFSISMTFGVVARGQGEHYEKAIQRADELLYYGKGNGRNQVVDESVLEGE